MVTESRNEVHYCETDFSSNTLHSLSIAIYEYSEYVKDFYPANVLIDKPQDQSSRWACSARDSNQFITLRIVNTGTTSPSLPLAVVKEITFGKYHLPHVCNLKEFKVLVSIDGTEWKEALHYGLKNDGVPESFPLKFHIENLSVYYPVQFIKIIPLATWGIGFNYGIWNIQLKGITDISIVNSSIKNYLQFQSIQAWCNSSYLLNAPSLTANVFTEHKEIFSKLYDSLESRKYGPLMYSLIQLIRKFPLNEALPISIIDRLVESIVPDGNSNRFSMVEWTEYDRPSEAKSPTWPSERGGHQLCFDSMGKKLYLFGGWDGDKEFSDFWAFDTILKEWTLISNDVSINGGPSPRSVHRCVIDSTGRFLYLLGRYPSSDSSNHNLACDFYRFHLDTHSWELLSSNTKLENGPDLIYDHQLAFDEKNRKLWVFGGKISTVSTSHPTFSGLYSYSLDTKTWKHHLSDLGVSGDTISTSSVLVSRVSFLMFFDYLAIDKDVEHPVLIIINGQRHLEDLHEIVVYDTKEEKVLSVSNLLFSKSKTSPIVYDYLTNSPSFSMKGIFLKSKKEIVLLIPSKKIGEEKGSHFAVLVHSFGKELLLDSKQNWNCWEVLEDSKEAPRASMRYASNLVIDDDERSIWLFGGTTIASVGENKNSIEKNVRLNDLWELKLVPRSHKELTVEMKVLVRQCMFFEKIASFDFESQDPQSKLNFQSEALFYLREQMEPFITSTSHVVQKILTTLPECLFLNSSNYTSGDIDSQMLHAFDLEDIWTLTNRDVTDPSQFKYFKSVIEHRKALIKNLLSYL